LKNLPKKEFIPPERGILLHRLEVELQKKTKEKYRVSPKKILERSLRKFCALLLLKQLRKQMDQPINNWAPRSRFHEFYLGEDELGRDVMAELAKYIELVKSRGLHVHTVVVLGSRAKQRHKPHSDVDLLVIGDNSPKGLRKLLFFSDWPIIIGTQVIACTRDEFLRWLEELSLVAVDSMYYGKVILDDGFWSMAKARFENIERTYQLRKKRLIERMRAV